MLTKYYPTQRQTLWSLMAGMVLLFLVIVNSWSSLTGEISLFELSFYSVATWLSLLILLPIAIIQLINAAMRRPHIIVDDEFIHYVGIFKRKTFLKNKLQTYRLISPGTKYLITDGTEKIIVGKYEMPEPFLDDYDFPSKKPS